MVSTYPTPKWLQVACECTYCNGGTNMHRVTPRTGSLAYGMAIEVESMLTYHTQARFDETDAETMLSVGCCVTDHRPKRLLECVMKMTLRDGITHPEVHMCDVYCLRLTNLESIELQAKQRGYSFRFMVANVGRSEFHLGVHTGAKKGPNTVLFDSAPFIPLDTIHCRTYGSVTLELITQGGLTHPIILLWAPGATFGVREAVSSLLDVSGCNW